MQPKYNMTAQTISSFCYGYFDERAQFKSVRRWIFKHSCCIPYSRLLQHMYRHIHYESTQAARLIGNDLPKYERSPNLLLHHASQGSGNYSCEVQARPIFINCILRIRTTAFAYRNLSQQEVTFLTVCTDHSVTQCRCTWQDVDPSIQFRQGIDILKSVHPRQASSTHRANFKTLLDPIVPLQGPCSSHNQLSHTSGTRETHIPETLVPTSVPCREAYVIVTSDNIACVRDCFLFLKL